jgi:Tfp pilus assembly protein PilE
MNRACVEALTLIELLTVIGVAAVFAALVVPVTSAMRAGRNACNAQLTFAICTVQRTYTCSRTEAGHKFQWETVAATVFRITPGAGLPRSRHLVQRSKPGSALRFRTAWEIQDTGSRIMSASITTRWHSATNP